MEAENYTTIKEYWEDTYKFSTVGKVLKIDGENEAVQIILDRTVFHPQGGGQPKDKGTISSADGAISFEVSDLKEQGESCVIHIGKYTTEGAKFEVGNEVTCQIDADFRKTNARIHSAGHLLDVAMRRAGKEELRPGKGYHFVEGPYVEYIGVVPEAERAALCEQLAKHCNDMIAEAKENNTQVFRKMCTYEEAGEVLAGGVPPYVKEGNNVRCLKLIPEDHGCPCGGTHVHSIPEIGRVEIVKMQKKKQNTQVKYKVIYEE